MGTIQQFDELKTRRGNRGMKFKDVLRDLRKQVGMTQKELAKKAGVPLPSLRGHEQGQRVPSWGSVVKLAKALNVSTDAFSDCDEVREEEKPTPKRKRKGKAK
jgi:transcriptional regulator with XRE-family HTH domain